LKGYQKADIFSFGVIVWEIINRKIPWNDSLLEEIEFQIRFHSDSDHLSIFFFFFFFFLKKKKKKKNL